jgi:signal transduction histidine kinase
MRSVRLRVLATILAVSLVTLAGVGLFSSRIATIDLADLTLPSMHVDVAALTRSIETAYVRSHSWREIGPVLRALGSRDGVRVLIVSPSGRAIASSDTQLAGATTTLDRAGVLHIDEAGSGPAGAGSSMDSTIELQSPASVIKDAGERRIALVYVLPAAMPAPRPPPVAAAADIGRSIWIAIAIAGLAAAIAAVVLSSYILRPIEALTAASARLAAGDLGARVAPLGADEIGDLGRSFNAMADGLARLERLREDMVADIAHELRTPLTHIRGRIEAIQDGRITPSQDVIDALHEDALLLQRLVQDLQDLSLADAGALRLAREPVSLDAMLSAQISAMPAAHLPITVRLDAALPRVYADPARLRQMLNNLLDNAVRHTPDGGSVWIGARALAGRVEVTVHNDGSTLDEADLSAIFERFYRADRSRSRDTGGAGLGLAIVKKLVEAHGGRVRAENTTPPGVSVIFTLPTAR